MSKVVYNGDGSYEGFEIFNRELAAGEGEWKKYYRQVRRYDRAKGDTVLNPEGDALAVMLFGELGTVVLRLYRENKHRPDTFVAGELGYHWRKATSVADLAHGLNARKCPYLEGRPCYYAGERLDARGPVADFITGGEQAFWFALEAYYRKLAKQEDDLASVKPE